MIGTERSGSNLLRLILNAHSGIAVPHPPHFMRYLAPIAASYGDLSEERNRRALTRDALLLLRRHIHPWDHPVDEDLVVAAATPTLFGVVAAIYERYRIATGKRRWGCKSTFMVDHVPEVLAEYPAARLVWLVRDPRDVAASAARSVFGHCHPYLTAHLWRRQQERALAALETWGPDTIHLLRYEYLVADPEQAVTGLCAFLGEPVEPAMLQHHRSDAARQTARLSHSWRNAGGPITAASVGRHGRSLTREDRRQVECVAGSLMDRLGYCPEERPGAEPPSPGRVSTRDLLLRTRVEYRSLRHDANHWRRWGRDWTARWLRVKAAVRGGSAPGRAVEPSGAAGPSPPRPFVPPESAPWTSSRKTSSPTSSHALTGTTGRARGAPTTPSER